MPAIGRLWPSDDDDEDQDYDHRNWHHNDEDIDDSACLNPFPLRIFLEVLKSGLQVIADADSLVIVNKSR